MNFDYKKYLNLKTIMPVLEFTKKYIYLIGSVAVIIVFFIIISRIDSLAGVELNQERYDKGILELERITFDEEAIENIKALQNRDVTVDLDLPSDRDNPF